MKPRAEAAITTSNEKQFLLPVSYQRRHDARVPRQQTGVSGKRIPRISPLGSIYINQEPEVRISMHVTNSQLIQKHIARHEPLTNKSIDSSGSVSSGPNFFPLVLLVESVVGAL